MERVLSWLYYPCLSDKVGRSINFELLLRGSRHELGGIFKKPAKTRTAVLISPLLLFAYKNNRHPSVRRK